MSQQLPVMRQLTPSLSACGQLTLSNIQALAELGVKSLICNRPDHEDPEQPSAASLQDYAESLGLEWYFQPVISGQVEDAQGDEFAQLLAKATSPVVAFCRSGARCGMLWALSQRHEQPGSLLVEHLKSSGYDMPDFFARLLQSV